MKRVSCTSLAGLLGLLLLTTHFAMAAGLAVIEGEYKLPASLDTAVSDSVQTELWAHVTRPDSGGPYPLVVFLHGNHGTCGRYDPVSKTRIDDRSDYTDTGTCPAGYVVTPNHMGYQYLARPLAEEGFVVVSINANRGINAAAGENGDWGLNLRRGRLILRHLQQLADWNRNGGAPSSLGFDLKGLMDFSQVGLMGHSRGGEGVRAALEQFADAGSIWPDLIGPISFQAAFEIGPVDGQTSRTLNAKNVHWNVILPGCDGDVSDLEGIKPFDRMLNMAKESAVVHKSTIQVFGANHNFYNTEWQQSDAWSCQGENTLFPQTHGARAQRLTAIETLIPFFKAHMGPRLDWYANRFDSGYPVPTVLSNITSYARGFTATPRAAAHFVVDKFNQATGISTHDVANAFSGLAGYTHGSASFNDDPSQKAAAIDWTASGGYLQLNVTNEGTGIDVQEYPTLEFRVMLRCFADLCAQAPAPDGDLDFSIALVNADNSLSAAQSLKSHAVVHRPAGSFSVNMIFQTVRIPVAQFSGANVKQFHGVRFSFDKDSASSIYLANVQLTKSATYSPTRPLGESSHTAMPAAIVRGLAEPDRNQIVALYKSTVSRAVGDGLIELELSSSRKFTVMDALPVLKIGAHRFVLSRYASGRSDHLVFSIPEHEFAALPDTSELRVQIGGATEWRFAALDKSLLK